ncbi:glycosyltransferase family 2 protein [Thermoflexus sp.]|uniref:glycosyltransferase family 2 protein n=1 Tax=Thermoflexus sp. TaxID=1969742 RepID=UPI0025F9BFE5|nr:glycosyltransferase family 2 protein [Thermoflexus sp.]MDW8181773.1 glycosyltransferase family 2 protein [Anaerolineae bacterium]MCS6962708.1 glycosyltransferase family 2 protein [Thermoflexus sp.]MCS7352310.1 glycosyltransferase family 2 protein [Thermoflexus sp.]MCX7691629.1 glycosyltransferase family 2 protein [Thermoflexus sp.]MDW8185523.1 glycosyltransferase family 2 protein [Anaerolineae bacterium]
MSEPLISVIIPNWNGAAHLPTCLEALRRQTYARREVIVVDNGSTDDSLQVLARYPEVRILALRSNQGFAGAVNAGIRAALGELIALLNNDTEASPAWLETLTAAFERHPDAGLLASKILLFDRRNVFHSAGDYYRVDGIPGNRGVWEIDEGQYDHEEEVFSACGAAAAYRRELFRDIGFFDEDFFYSCEDMDLAWRAQIAGWNCWYVPTAVVYHKLSATGGGPTASFYDGRNFIYLIAKDYPTGLLRRFWPQVFRAQWRIAREALRAWRGTAARARLRGMLAGFLTWPRVARKRPQVFARRRRSDEALFARLTPGAF